MGDITTDALQQDIYQRYTVLARLLTSVFPHQDDTQVVTVLDIGSGPERLTERFLPGHFRVTRADVNTFGDEGVVALTPGASLPFESHSFAAVVAIEVLEHVPALERDALISECARVSSDLVVLCCPVASEPTTRAEEIFQSLAVEISGSASPFLAEHKSIGLPDAAAVRAALERRIPHVIELPNAPLPEWLVYNLIDLAYACDFGDVDEKARFNTGVNAKTPLAAGGPHYRRFFAGCTDPDTRDRVAEAARQVSSGTVDPMDAAIGMAEALVRFRADLLRKHADGLRDALQAKDAHIQALDQVIATLQAEIRHDTLARTESAAAASPVHSKGGHAEAGPLAQRNAPDSRHALLDRARSRIRTLRLGRRVPRELRELVARSGLFDVDFYRERHPDVAASGVDPVVHYLAVGAGEGRNPHPLFDSAFYVAQAPAVGSSGINPLVHYIRHGGAEGLTPHPLFDSRFYVACHPEGVRGDSTPLAHYVATGAQTRWNPSPVFWSGYYLETNPDVAAAGINPLTHYVLIGVREGRNPNPLFDTAHYLARTGAVLPGGADPLLHYLSSGAADGYDPHPLFDTRHYLTTYPDVAAAGVNPLTHYLLHGGAEARNPNALFDAAWYREAAAVPPGSNPLVHYLREDQSCNRTPHPLFDAGFYLAAHPEVATGPAEALGHYLQTGAETRWDPSPLFSAVYYLERNPDVAAAGANPFVHYVLHGGAEGRNPNPLFDGGYYLARNPDVAASGTNPLVHYLLTGASEGRKPSALFDTTYYLKQNPDVAAAGVNPLAHYLVHGRSERRRPNALFDPDFYLSANPDVAAANADPLLHFLDHGAAEGRNPSEAFETSFYLRENLDVAAAGLNPLAHYLDHGREEGRRARAPETGDRATTYPGFVPPVGLLPWFNPLTLRIEPGLDDTPALNVLVPGLAMEHMSGGPNTALHIAYRLGLEGVRIRFISTDAPLGDREALWKHVLQLADSEQRLPHVEFADGHDRRRPLAIGRNDLFFATAWWTAQMAKFGCELTRSKRFVYLIQDFEPLFHPASTPQALALETYSLDYVPIVNSQLLFDYLTQNGVGRFATPEFANQALVFEPAVDRSHFFVAPQTERRRRLLFYTRPTTGLRNLYEIGVAALMDAVGRGVFDNEPWEILGMGESIIPVDLGRGFTLSPAPWLDFARYASQMRESDILLSLMLSPHPSYPPLEMAACGGLVVTNTYACKTVERLAQLSPNIIGAEPTFEGVAEAIRAAVRGLANEEQRRAGATLNLPGTWKASLVPVVDRLKPLLLAELGVPTAPAFESSQQLAQRLPCGFDTWPMNRYEVYRINRLRKRRARLCGATATGMFSFVTAVWNTDGAMLQCLADSLLNQHNAAAFEWVILDNGSDRPETLDVLERIRHHPVVRLHRSPSNLGIVAGLRQCIELAANRYLLFVDHDDFVSPDCVDVIATFVVERGFPTLFYTDEEKLSEKGYGTGYFKSGWDPVLFVNSCFIAHLCGVDREVALELSCCDDSRSEGSHDWDTFMRFVLAGHVPQHLPETLYTWRAHEGSTAENIHSKPYVFTSQQHVLGKFLQAHPQSALFRLEKNPLFDDSPDWWIRRLEENPQPITTVLWSMESNSHLRTIPVDACIPHELVTLQSKDYVTHLHAVARECDRRGRLLHLMVAEIDLDGPEWAWEAMGLLELFPDVAMVGGRIHDGTRILTAGQMFGFGRACDSPDEGRLLHDPGYFGQMWKPHSVSAVSCLHAVMRPRLLLDTLEDVEGLSVSLRNLGVWLGGQARRTGRRVVYSPFLSGRAHAIVDGEVSDPEHGLFRVVNADLIPESQLLSPHLGLTPATAYLPVTQETRRRELKPPPSVLLEYPDWLTARVAARKRLYPRATSAPSISILTAVYSGTPAHIFDATAESLLQQSRPFSEWVILAHGNISPELEQALQRLERSPGVRVIRRPDNLGIVGGMRECLLAARGDYVVPLDADDLLTTDALAVLATTIARHGSPLLVYSDEDIWRAERPESPYLRPDFDPILNLETSYVWHVCAIRRDGALEHGLYTDALTEYCHDWDSVTRLAAVELPVHVPEVLYHWRHHSASHTNRAEGHPGSLASTRHLLEGRIAQLPHPSHFEVAEFPIFRGAIEWYIRRKPVDPPPAAVVIKSGDHGSSDWLAETLSRSSFPFRSVSVLRSDADLAGTLNELARDGLVRYVAVLSAGVRPSDDEWMWEAVRLFECHPAIAVCGGRLIDPRERVVDSAGVLDESGTLVHPFVGLGRLDPGPFALALKPHLVATVPDAFYVIAMDALPAERAEDRTSALRMSAAAWAQERTVAYSPLIEGRATDSSAQQVDAGTDYDERRLAGLRTTLAGRRQGAGGFVHRP